MHVSLQKIAGWVSDQLIPRRFTSHSHKGIHAANAMLCEVAQNHVKMLPKRALCPFCGFTAYAADKLNLVTEWPMFLETHASVTILSQDRGSIHHIQLEHYKIV